MTDIPQPNEMPRTYSPLAPLARLAPLLAQVTQRQRTLANLDHQSEQNDNSIRRAESFIKRCDLVRSAINDKEEQHLSLRAQSLLAEENKDLSALEAEISELRFTLAEREKEAEAALKAIDTLEFKAGDLGERRSIAVSHLEKALEAWLLAKQQRLLDDVRRKLHDLHSDFAAILAIEEHTGFHRHNPRYALRYSEALGQSLRYDSPIRPVWFGVTRRSMFPGFSSAVEALDAEIAGGASDDDAV